MPYESSYLLLQKSARDKTALRAHLSLRYSLITPGTFTEGLVATGNDLFLSYNGEFDFYASTRHSSPVVNRLNNPALHYRFNYAIDNNTWLNYLKWIDVGLEHRSNGQPNEVKSPEEIARAQKAYDDRDRAYLDTISRSANFVSTELHSETPGNTGSLSLSAKLKFYLSDDSKVTFGPWANPRTKIADYDRVKILARGFLKDTSEIGVEWTIGDRGFKTDSFNIDYLVSKNLVFPLYIRYHVGPMNTLSNYTQFEQSVGVGIKFTP